jgi:hypothetical protein
MLRFSHVEKFGEFTFVECFAFLREYVSAIVSTLVFSGGFTSPRGVVMLVGAPVVSCKDVTV